MENKIPKKNQFTKLTLEELETLYFNDLYIPYHELLRTDCWDKKRSDILDRDKFRCQNCQSFNAYYNKYNELVWGFFEMIIWEDLEGNIRFSTPEKPTHKPDKEYQIHIHHKRYVKNRYPWEYENEDLITLCHHCHLKTHKENEIPVFDENGKEMVSYEPCDRCNGKGNLSIYNYVQGGICFKCRGLGININLIDKKLK